LTYGGPADDGGAIRLEKQTLESLERLCALTGIGRSALLRRMVKNALAAQVSDQTPAGTD
jgi:hypothetical protein